MWKPKKIFVPTDFSVHANRAVAYAAIVAERFQCEITLFHVIAMFEYDPNNPGYRFPNAEEVYASLEKQAGKNMQDIHDRHGAVAFKNVMTRGFSPAEEIRAYLAENAFDLVVMGTHGRSGLGHFLMGSVAEKVSRHSTCPVMTIRYKQGDEEIQPGFRRIVVPNDFSTYSKHAITRAGEFAKAFNASLQFIHVIEERVHPAYYVTGETSIFDLIPDLRERSMQAMQEFVKGQIPDGVDHTFHIREGRAHTEIVHFAEEQHADLIAIATHGLSGLDHLFLGSTTEKVIRRASIPVLTVKVNQ